MRISLVQMQSSNDLKKNLSTMESYVQKAVDETAELVVFPEMAYFTGKREEWLPLINRFEEFKTFFAALSRKHGIAICSGTFREPVAGVSDKYHNTLLFTEPNGTMHSYRKIFLYQAVMPDRIYEESKYCVSGKEVKSISYQGIHFGFAICFDLRFPELFRSLKKQGAEVILLPAAFTVPTGEKHWETLVRARAIENQCFLVAPGLTGTSGDGAKTYGHSLLVNPWGEVTGKLSDAPEMRTFEIQTNEISHCASKVSCWKSVREDLFPIR